MRRVAKAGCFQGAFAHVPCSACVHVRSLRAISAARPVEIRVDRAVVARWTVAVRGARRARCLHQDHVQRADRQELHHKRDRGCPASSATTHSWSRDSCDRPGVERACVILSVRGALATIVGALGLALVAKHHAHRADHPPKWRRVSFPHNNTAGSVAGLVRYSKWILTYSQTFTERDAALTACAHGPISGA